MILNKDVLEKLLISPNGTFKNFLLCKELQKTMGNAYYKSLQSLKTKNMPPKAKLLFYQNFVFSFIDKIFENRQFDCLN